MKPEQTTTKSEINWRDPKKDRRNHYMLHGRQWEWCLETVDEATRT